MAVFCVSLQDFLLRKEFQSDAKLCNKTAIITGGNTGIGKETALDLAHRGAKVIIACRDVEKGKVAAEDIRKQVPNADVVVRHLNLASFSSIQRCAEEILMSIAACPKSKTVEGFEMQFGVNHLGHFLFTNLLLERIKASTPARIINVASIAHTLGKIHFSDIHLERRYNSISAYCHSKLANVLFTRELSRRLKGTGITTYCVDPGPTRTELGRYLGMISGYIFSFYSRLLYKSAKKGAQTTIYCAVEESLSEESGLYYW
ncbi:hypothetical protein TNIN_422561 [Trichonephila inaurata madagascariensis]|uniref:Retinol dehydrogenase 11 n=1 Tax=Trichonephila inaurata madagascariensis TaxID=2747483 RepID=A0A8X7C2I8_9ARAC|nr:hypothetical protein TNIN_422561 [Trichonephila inaurata madagascariensis]